MTIYFLSFAYTSDFVIERGLLLYKFKLTPKLYMFCAEMSCIEFTVLFRLLMCREVWKCVREKKVWK